MWPLAECTNLLSTATTYRDHPGHRHSWKNSSLTRDAWQKKEMSRVEKKNGRRAADDRVQRCWVVARHHATSRAISDSLTPPTVLSRWSFISRRHQECENRRWQKRIKIERRGESVRNFESIRILCVSWPALLWAVNSLIVSGSITIIYISTEKKIFSAAANLDLL